MSAAAGSGAPGDDPLATTIAGWLPRARWFAGKGIGPVSVTIADRAPVPGGITLALVDVTAGGVGDRYVVPVDGQGADAATAPGFAHWLVDTVAHGRALQGRRGAFVGHGTGGVPLVVDPSAVVRPLGGDASNTSLALAPTRTGEAAKGQAIKLLRRCRPGIQPEVEVGAFLARSTDWTDTPRLIGWLEYLPTSTPQEPATSLATIHAFAAGCTSSWERLGLLVGGADAAGSPEARALVAELGRVTAAMHGALASRPDVPAFAPQPTTAGDLVQLAAALETRATAVLAEIAARGAPAGGLGPRLAAVAAAGDLLTTRFRAIAGLAETGTFIRVHGDYHLGQVLVTPEGRALVIDFEGEPARPLAERRAKTSACKDVAGMCRSFDYLVRQGARDRGVRPGPEDARRLEETFLAAYRDVAAGHDWWPVDHGPLLEAFRLDKAIYELAYECANRPDWIEVPLAAIEATLA